MPLSEPSQEDQDRANDAVTARIIREAADSIGMNDPATADRLLALAAEVEHPADQGHTFRISHESRGSHKVVGDEHYTDEPEFVGPVHTVEVRAWNLRAALHKAAELPFNVLMGEPSD